MANINRSIRKIKTEEMAEFHLKIPHVSCLYYLYKKDTLTAKELCDICEEDKANVSRALDYLQTNGYLVRQNEENKKYKSHLALTEMGRSVAGKIVEKIDRILEEAGEGISDADREIMYRSLFQISTNLQKRCNQYDN